MTTKQIFSSLVCGIAVAALSACSWLPFSEADEAVAEDGSIPLAVATFNVESGDANPSVLADQYIAPLDDIDLWGFAEVQNADWLKTLERGTEAGEGADFRSILGLSGGGDRLAIVYDTRRLREVQHYELDALSYGGRVRATLVAQFQIRSTRQEFLFVVNHLYRSDNAKRHEQAQALNTWARTQSLPIVAVGDYNYDFDVIQGDQGKRDRGFDLMVQDDVFQWVRPSVLIASHCHQDYNSILDFVFVGNGARQWSVRDSTILFAEPGGTYCPDDAQKSDHRPVMTTFWIPHS